jgi:nucleotide-binding universal stress UspA family protein
MFKHIIVPLDGSAFSETALPYALEMARKFDAELTLAHIVASPSVVVSELVTDSADLYLQMREHSMSQADDYLANKTHKLRDEGFIVNPRLVEGDDIAGELIDLTERIGADCIVMTSHGRAGVSRWLFGSVAGKVMQHAHVPVLVIRPEPEIA